MLESILDVCCLRRRERDSSQLMLSPIFGGISDKKHSRLVCFIVVGWGVYSMEGDSFGWVWKANV